jgi:hypothetical protein
LESERRRSERIGFRRFFFFNLSGRNLAGRCIRPGPDGGGVAAGGSAGVAGRRGEARAAGARGGRKEARRGRGGQPPDGGGGADDGAAHQGRPRRVPRLRVQAQGELEVRGFDTLSPFFFLFLRQWVALILPYW